MTHWKKVKLGDVANFKNGKGIDFRNTTGAFPVYGGNGIVATTEKYNSENETLIVGRVGAFCGSVFYTKQNCWVTDNAIVGKAKSQSDARFLYYLLTQLQLNNFRTGSSQPLLNQETLNSIDIEIPDLPTQTRIASILSALDDKIELNRQMNHTLEQMAQALFKKYFVDDIDPENLPEGWRMGKFEDYVNVLRGLSYKGAGLCEKNEGIPMHNLNSVYEGGGYKYTGIKYYKGEFKERHQIKPWDIIVTNTEQGHKYLLIGYPAIVPKYFGDKGIFSQHIYKLELKNEDITSQFFYYLILQYSIREQIVACTNGTTVNMLSIDGLQKPEFIVPPKRVLNKFSETVKSIWLKQESNYLENENMTYLRNSLLPKLMSGEIETKEAETMLA